MPNMNGYTLKQVAGEVGVSTATIVRWIDTKKVNVPKRKNSRGHYFFTEADLRKFLDHNNLIITE